jgi:predicted Rossmann-fold nucleotide-binding protein
MQWEWRWSKHLELLSGQKEKMKRRIRTITVFGSSRPRESDNECTIARHLGAELVKKGFSVCTGGYGGVMEAVPRGAHDEGGQGNRRYRSIFQVDRK